MSTDERDPDAPPSEEELAESQRLREALDDASKDHPDAELLRAVQSAARPKLLPDAELERAVAGSLGKPSSSGGVVIRVVFGAGLLVAAAAVAIVYLKTPHEAPEALVRVRSTQSLFSERFEARGGESARIDRIAMARAADLRENHFARWGVPARGKAK